MLLDVLRAPPFRNAKTKPFWRLLCDTLAALGDVRVLDALTALEATYDQVMANDVGPSVRANMRKSIETIQKVKVSLPEEKALALLQTRLRGALDDLSRRTARPDFGPLFEAVWNAPEDDAPRAVLADALTEAGDARGAFITEQLATRARKETSTNRATDVLLGRLSMVVIHPTFERGFPVDGWIWFKKKEWFTQVTGLPEWSTFTHLKITVTPLRDTWRESLVPMLMSPALKSLRSLTVRSDVTEWMDPVLERCEALELSTPPDALAQKRFERWKRAKAGRTIAIKEHR